MVKQKITLGSNGVVQLKRAKTSTVRHAARVTPAVKLTRLHQLLRTKSPKILLIRGEGIGDVIMTTPTISAIKEMFPDSEIIYATNMKYLDGALVKTLAYNPEVSHIVDRDQTDNIIYDLVIDLHCPAGPFEQPRRIPANRIDLFANHAGVKLTNPVPKFYVQEDEVEQGELLLQTISSQEKVMLVQPFASSHARSGTQAKIKKAVTDMYNQYGIRSVILTHGSDISSDVLWNNVPGSIFLRDLDIRGIAGVMVHCDLVLCPDSSILHLAGALGVPTVGLFGPTPPQSRINHYQNATAVWMGGDMLPCPCWYQSHNCPIGHACWSKMTSDMIVNKCVEHLQNSNRVDIVHLLNNIKPIQIETEIL